MLQGARGAYGGLARLTIVSGTLARGPVTKLEAPTAGWQVVFDVKNKRNVISCKAERCGESDLDPIFPPNLPFVLYLFISYTRYISVLGTADQVQ